MSQQGKNPNSVPQSPQKTTEPTLPSAPCRPQPPTRVGFANIIEGSPILQPPPALERLVNPGGSPSMVGRRNGSSRQLIFTFSNERSGSSSAFVHPSDPTTLIINSSGSSGVRAHPIQPGASITSRKRKDATDTRPNGEQPPSKKSKTVVSIDIPDTEMLPEAPVASASSASVSCGFAPVASASNAFAPVASVSNAFAPVASALNAFAPNAFAPVASAPNALNADEFQIALQLFLFSLFHMNNAFHHNSISMVNVHIRFMTLFNACDKNVQLFALILNHPYLKQFTMQLNRMADVFRHAKQHHHHNALAGYIDDVILYIQRNPDASPNTVERMLSVLNTYTNKEQHRIYMMPRSVAFAIMRQYATYCPPLKNKTENIYYTNEEIASLEWNILMHHMRRRFGLNFFF